MTGGTCDILVREEDHRSIVEHLFPGDRDEHGAILRAGIVRSGTSLRLLVQNVQPARFGTDYVSGRYGYRALTPTFIHREIMQCRTPVLHTLLCTIMEATGVWRLALSIWNHTNAAIRRSSTLGEASRLGP